MAAGEPGLTHWSRFDVAGMWSLIRGVSTDDAFRQAGAWQSTYEAAQSLAGRLRWYRDGLAGKWSPDGSEAAAAYLGRLDELIGSAQQLADVAVSNRQALVTLANAVDEARPKMQRVYEESQAMRQVGAQPRAGAALALRQQQLQNQATQIMESLGSAALDSWRHYATADDYQPPQSVHGREVPVAAPEAADAPNLRSKPSNSTETAGSLGGESGLEASDVRRSPRSRSGSARTLGRSESTTDSMPAGVSLTASSAPTKEEWPDQSAITSSVGADAFGHDAQTRSISSPIIGQRVQRSVDVVANRIEDSIMHVPRALRPGGVVGEHAVMPSSDLTAQGGQPANAAGGVIGGEGAATGVTGFGRGPSGGGRQRERRREYDVDDPWYVAEGVAPILRPLPDPIHFDPGPGVIGIDR